MLRKVAAIALSVFLALPTYTFGADKPHSVQALQGNGETFCTTFSINELRGYWATAAHCAAYALQQNLAVTILGQPAFVIFIGFPATDIAIFQSDAKVPALKLASRAVLQCNPWKRVICETISIVGWPYGIARTVTQGTVGANDIPILHPSTGYVMYSDILDITVVGGNSGSPVLNARGEVIGLLWGGFTQSPHSLSMPFAAVKGVLKVYWG